MSPRLRDALQRPRDFALKKAWVALIRGLRAHKRATGQRSDLAGRGPLEALLDRPLRSTTTPADLDELDLLLRSLVRGDLPDELAAPVAWRAAEMLEAVVVAVAREPVDVVVDGIPEGFGAAERARLGVPVAPLPPMDAARLVHRLDGLVLAGCTLRVHAELPEDTALPSLSRDDRNRARRNPQGPWLPHTEPAALKAVTPQHLAEAQAALLVELGATEVIDGFTGLGGDAVAQCLAGLRVHGVERDPARLHLARRNLEAFGVAAVMHEGDATALVPELLGRHPDAALFLDPPWHGPDGGLRTTWAALVPETLHGTIDIADIVVIELPAAFDVATLPGGYRWRACFGTEATGDHDVVKALTAWRATGV